MQTLTGGTDLTFDKSRYPTFFFGWWNKHIWASATWCKLSAIIVVDFHLKTSPTTAGGVMMTLNDLPLGKNFWNDLNGLPKIIHLFHMLKRKNNYFWALSLAVPIQCILCMHIMYFLLFGHRFLHFWVGKTKKQSLETHTPPTLRGFQLSSEQEGHTLEHLWCVSWQAVGFVRENRYIHSLQLTANNPENRPGPKRKGSSPNHPLSGAMIVSGRVCSFTGTYPPCYQNQEIFSQLLPFFQAALINEIL